MNTLELQLKELIIKRYGSLKRFSEAIHMPWTTLDSILKRGVANSNITNILKITRELKIDTEALVAGEIKENHAQADLITIAAHFDGDEYTEEELTKIKEFAEFVKSSRK